MLGIIGGTGSGKVHPGSVIESFVCRESGKISPYHQGHSPKTLKEWREGSLSHRRQSSLEGLSARISY